MKAKCIVLFIMLYSAVNAQYKILHIFNDTNGMNPWGSLTLVGSKLYGLTQYGGADKKGCIFSLDTNGSNYKDLFDFSPANGEYPEFTQLTYSEKKLYGMASEGGTHNAGCVFSIDTNGNDYKVVFNFTGTTGWVPQGSVTISGNRLYGMTAQGGIDGYGCIFSMDTNGNGYKKLLDFNDSNGKQPYGDLTLFNNVLYGMTYYGGKYNDGVIFSIDSNGSGYKKLLDFNDSNGANPLGSLTLSGSTLYGMTQKGGSQNSGCLFSMDTDGNTYKDLYNFGSFPFGSLILSGNTLYGMTPLGGQSAHGNIFSIDTNGNTYNNLFYFDKTDGSLPQGSLILSGNMLYGVTSGGALDNNGVIFAFKDTNITTSINEVKVNYNTIKVYPNPSNGVFTIVENGKLKMENEQNTIEVYNVLGEKIYSQLSTLNSQFSIDLSNQPNGIYLYRVITETGELIGSGKLIIAH
jgi:uncharacterized repeat protein (TIGR03803 family)